MPPMPRRSLLKALALTPLASLPLALRLEAQQAGLITGNVCMVQRETTEGPFYMDPGLVRADITEGRTGVPLTLRLQVVDQDCAPLSAARVDIWQTDAEGEYSAFRTRVSDARGQTFMRGTQITDADGVAAFTTVYPGWYPGRTPHVHYKVFLSEREVLTSQVFFPDEVSDQVYTAGGAYPSGLADTRNTTDRIARRAGQEAVAAVSGGLSALAADLVVGVA